MKELYSITTVWSFGGMVPNQLIYNAIVHHNKQEAIKTWSMTEKLTKIMFAMPKQQPLIPLQKEKGYRSHKQYPKQSRIYNIKLKVPSISQCLTIYSQFIPPVWGMLDHPRLKTIGHKNIENNNVAIILRSKVKELLSDKVPMSC